jgi:hypothetical protein
MWNLIGVDSKKDKFTNFSSCKNVKSLHLISDYPRRMANANAPPLPKKKHPLSTAHV